MEKERDDINKKRRKEKKIHAERNENIAPVKITFVLRALSSVHLILIYRGLLDFN